MAELTGLLQTILESPASAVVLLIAVLALAVMLVGLVVLGWVARAGIPILAGIHNELREMKEEMRNTNARVDVAEGRIDRHYRELDGKIDALAAEMREHNAKIAAIADMVAGVAAGQPKALRQYEPATRMFRWPFAA